MLGIYLYNTVSVVGYLLMLLLDVVGRLANPKLTRSALLCRLLTVLLLVLLEGGRVQAAWKSRMGI